MNIDQEMLDDAVRQLRGEIDNGQTVGKLDVDAADAFRAILHIVHSIATDLKRIAVNTDQIESDLRLAHEIYNGRFK